jgi:peptide/nickel transport system substrate-binding protein
MTDQNKPTLRQGHHPGVATMREQLAEGRTTRRDFLRTVTLLGVSAGTAYAMADSILGESVIREAAAQGTPVKGGILRAGMAVKEVTDPAIVDWTEKGNALRPVLEPLAEVGTDNITRPKLAERWEANDDLTQWTFYLRKNVTWNNGDAFIADDVIANFERWLDPSVGSSNLGRFSALTVEDGESRVAAPNATVKIDDHTVQFNLQRPMLQFPESLGDYPALIAHRSLGETLASGSNWVESPIGTGPFLLTNLRVGEVAEYTKRDPAEYWGEEVHLDGLRYVDLGGDPAAHFAALASNQVDILYRLDINLLPQAQSMPTLQTFEITTAICGLARMRISEAPFDDIRVRRAIQKSVDRARLTEIAYQGLGIAGEDHHVSPVHPEYTPLPLPPRDTDAAKALLAEAGYPDGLQLTMHVVNEPKWESNVALAMREQVAEAGITLNVQVLPGGTYWERWDTWPLSITQWTSRPLGVQVLGLAYRSGVPWNETNYSNPAFDAALSKAEATLDLAERKQIVAELQKMMQDDAIIVLPFWVKLFTAATQRVNGFSYHAANEIHINGTWLA